MKSQVIEKHARLVEALYKKTQTNEIKWEPNGPNSYLAKIGDNFVSISSRYRPGEEEYDIDIGILNSNFETSDTFSDIDLSDLTPKDSFPYYYPLMKELLRIAGRNATGADAIIDEMLSALEPTPTGKA